MTRFGYLAVLLLLLSSSAQAGSFSFHFHGHRVRIERPRHCFARSCLSVTGLHGTRHEDRVDDVAVAPDASPAKSPVASPALPPAPSSSSSASASASASTSTSTAPAPAAAPPLVVSAQASTPPAVQPRAEFKVLFVEKPAVTAQTAPEAAPADAKASQQASSEPADTPLGDWQTEGNKGLVRIEPCGNALCGYAVDAATNAKGETVLINMKPKGTSDKSADEWTGTIVSRASGSTNYAKMSMKQSATLRVEACAVGRFFCSGNDWSRIVTKPQALITSRQMAAQPPS
jgi:uncharacterized protein (DUF2147 family)